MLLGFEHLRHDHADVVDIALLRGEEKRRVLTQRAAEAAVEDLRIIARRLPSQTDSAN